MRNIIFGTASAAILSLSLGTPAAADHARHDAEKLAPLIFGAVALYLLHERKDRKKKETVTPPSRPNVQTWHDRPRPDRPHRPNHFKRKVLPAECFKRVRTHNGKRAMFGKRCLNNNYRFVESLPRVCKTRVENRRGRIHRGYAASCLKKRGYRMSSF